jgi:hypothetical protein
MIGYTSNRMLMPGDFMDYTTNKEKIKRIIAEKSSLFIVTLKLGIPKERWNDCINFSPIIRNIKVGEKKEKKLIQLMTTMDEYMSFSSYYLWFLIDNFGFEIEDTKEMSIFYHFIINRKIRRRI